MLSGGYIKFGLANKGIAMAMQFFVYLLLPTKRLQVRNGREACMMDEIITVYYVAYTVFLCLSSIQIATHLVKDWHQHIRSSRKTHSKRK